jgi:hypothetical protein
MVIRLANVCFVPKADILRCGKKSSFDHLIGAGEAAGALRVLVAIVWKKLG